MLQVVRKVPPIGVIAKGTFVSLPDTFYEKLERALLGMLEEIYPGNLGYDVTIRSDIKCGVMHEADSELMPVEMKDNTEIKITIKKE